MTGAVSGFLRRLFGVASVSADPMPASTRLIVGLGNPGAEYADTRHNIGFVVADTLADRCRISFDTHKHSAVFGQGSWRSRPLVVAKPTTFMNRSGTAVIPLMRFYGLSPADILVIVDDIHLAPGDIRLRAGGGSGGHNGIEDITERAGTNAFPRLRMGIGKEFGRGGQSDYVLSPFDGEESVLVEDVVSRAVDAALTFVTDGIETAMNRFNRKSSAD